MKILYLDCGMGAAGDMLTAALYELLSDDEKKAFVGEMNALGIPGVAVFAERSEKGGIVGTHMRVLVDGAEETPEGVEHHAREHGGHHHEHDAHHADHDHHEHDAHHGDHAHHDHGHHDDHGVHHHRSLEEIENIIAGLAVSQEVRESVREIYALIAEAESRAHGVEVSEIHFHEVGTMDAIADVTAAALLMEKLSPDRVISSPVRVGSGQVRSAHGILPVPAPATAYILQNVPIYGGDIEGELCTPTGAALIKRFASDFGQMPVMRVEKIGYGMGTKDFKAANCLRAMLGEAEDFAADEAAELSCNLDDMTGEAIGFAVERLLAAGALDVYTVPIGMKKSRPAVMLCVICRPEDREAMARLIFRHTTTIGIRESIGRRYTLARRSETVQTPFGEVRVKCSEGYGVQRMKYEHDDVAKIAAEKELSIDEVMKKIHAAAEK